MTRPSPLLSDRGLPTLLTILIVSAVAISLLLPATRANRRYQILGSKPTDSIQYARGAEPGWGPTDGVKLAPARSESTKLAAPMGGSMSAMNGGDMMAMASGEIHQPNEAVVVTPADSAQPVAPARKIIYTATIDLNVTDFPKAVLTLESLVKSEKGYLAQSEVQGTPGSPQSGRWQCRVPVDRFEPFRQAVEKLGELQKSLSQADDVSEEYYDLEARIKNKKVEEARLLKHLEESTAKLKDTLEVERELSRVREEIERQEGRIRLLSNLSTMTTVTVTMHALTHFTPPSEPTFQASISRTFSDSVARLVDFGKAVVLAIVAITPWIPLLVLGALLLWLVLYLLVRRVRALIVRGRAVQPAA
jgi:hypothetical protein